MNIERLRTFLEKLPQGNRFAYEFRDPSWFDESVYEILSAHNASFCIYDLKGQTSPKDIYCYFNNEQAGYAVQNALALQAMSEDENGS